MGHNLKAATHRQNNGNAKSKPIRLPIDIHIGIEKTGSTSIQHYLALNREVLEADHRVLYPASLGGEASHNLVAACHISPTPSAIQQMLFLQTAEDINAYYYDLQEKLSTEIHHTQPDRLLLSSENFSSRLKTRDEISSLKDFLTPFASKFRILVYLRRQDKLISSAYTTRVKNGLTRPFQFPPEGFERHDSHYDQLLDRWADVFGEENILVRLYERHRLYGLDSVADFCHSFDIPADLLRAEQSQNTSLTENMLDFLRSLNQKLPYRIEGRLNPQRANIVQVLEALDFPGKRHDDYPGNNAFYQRFKTGNTKVAQRWFKNDSTVPPDLFQDTPSTPTPETDEQLEYDQLVEACAHLWSHCQQEIQGVRLERDCLRAELLMGDGQVESARSILKGLIRGSAIDAEPFFVLARLEKNTGNLTEALELAKRAAELSPDDQEIECFIADIDE